MTMRKLVILLGLFLVVTAANAVSTRSVTYLKDAAWTVTNKADKATPLADISKLSKGDDLVAQIDLDETDISELALYLYGGAEVFSVSINGEPVQNELTGEDFHAELPLIGANELKLELLAKKDISKPELDSLLEYAQLAALNNVFICHVNMMEDPFFGGKMVEADVKNMLDKDVDGKLIANVLDRKNLDLITENNNCAFSRKGSDIVIDINFPEADVLQKGKEYLLEISMVDKEKNEEVIDQLMVPVRF